MKAKEVRNTLNITQKTMNTYIKTGKLHPVVINANHYEYDRDEVYALLKTRSKRYNYTYSRVSLPKQKGDLETQTQRLYDFAVRNGYQIEEQLDDVKSGMEFHKRKNFLKLLDLVVNNKVDTVIVENRDRLTRFGFELLEKLFELHGTKIVVISNADNKTYEQELTDDLISIIHYYSMKTYSNRRRLHNAEKALKNKEDNGSDENVIEETTEDC